MKLLINNNLVSSFTELSLKELIFYIVFALHCLIGGAIAFWGIPFSPFYTSLLVLALIFLYPIKVDLILKFHVGLLLLIVVSALLNGSSIKDFIIGLRMPIISYTMYLVVDSFFNQRRHFVSFLKVVAFLQLPVVVFQLLAGDILIQVSSVPTAYHDIRYGTFFVKSDPIMSLFLVIMVVYILYRIKVKSKWDFVVLVSSSLTVVLASSRVIQLVLLFVLSYYFFINSNYKQKLYSIIVAVALLLIVFITGYNQIIFYQFNQLYANITGDQERQIRKFTEGEYARMGAIIYFLNEPLKLFGDGPGSHTNPLTGEMDLGLTGNNFKMYAEYGIVGLLYSLFGIILIVLAKLKRGIYSYFIILSVIGLTMTTDIYNHASLMFVFYLMIYIHQSIYSVEKNRFLVLKNKVYQRIFSG